MDIKSIENKDILILGLGREGESTFSFLRSIFPNKTLSLADQKELNDLSKKFRNILEKDANIVLYLGKKYLDSIKLAQVIFKTPGIPSKLIDPYLSKKINILSQIELFINEKRDNCIGITGTKGKSTTSSLIYHILKNSNIKSKLIGNIGKPVLSFIEDNSKQKFVIELSSHQLNNCEVSPHIAVFLNIFREHLDYYNNFEEYFLAKTNISNWQNKEDYFIYNNDVKELKDLAKKSRAKLISFGLSGKPNITIKDDYIYYNKEKIIDAKDLPIKGTHNVLNTMAAIGVAKILGIKNEKIVSSIKTFKPLLHRMELFAEHNGVTFYNDSIATIPEATIWAINTIKNISTLILGGLDRRQDFKTLSKLIIKSGIKNIILFPENDKLIAKNIEDNKGKKPKIFYVKNMKEATKIAFNNTKEGSCVLSPASASYNLFKDFKDRGVQFKKNIRILIKNAKGN